MLFPLKRDRLIIKNFFQNLEVKTSDIRVVYEVHCKLMVQPKVYVPCKSMTHPRSLRKS